MKICKKCNIGKELNSFSKQSSNKTGYRSSCKDCCREANRIYDKKNAKIVKSKKHIRYLKNQEKEINKSKLRYSNNKEKFKIRSSIIYKINPEKSKEYCRKYRSLNRDKCINTARKYRLVNRSRLNEWHASRRAQKLKATPKWLTNDHLIKIKILYNFSTTIQKLTNIKYHVDHIIPLRGKTVCGLHVPWNLRVVTAEENLKKNNKLVY